MNEEKMDELLRLMRSVVPDTSDMSDAGRVGFVYKFDYDPTVQYEELDVVKFGMSLWTPKKETIGNQPPDQSQEGQEEVEENEFWIMFLPGALGSDYVKKTDIAIAPTETEPGKAGVVIPDGKTIQIDKNGMLSGTPLDFFGTWKELQEGIASGEITEGMIGYIEGGEGEPNDPNHPNNMLIELDDYLSLYSSNAVQNRIIAGALEKMRKLIEQNAQIIEETRALRASVEAFGLAKECPIDLTDATAANSMFLGAQEKNPAVVGSISYSIENIKQDIFPSEIHFVCTAGEGRTGLGYPVPFSVPPQLEKDWVTFQFLRAETISPKPGSDPDPLPGYWRFDGSVSGTIPGSKINSSVCFINGNQIVSGIYKITLSITYS